MVDIIRGGNRSIRTASRETHAIPMGGAASTPSHAGQYHPVTSARRFPVMVDAISIQSALRDAGEKEEHIVELSEALVGYLQRREGQGPMDDATLLSLGVVKDTVRARLLQRLAGLGSPQFQAVGGLGAGWRPRPYEKGEGKAQNEENGKIDYKGTDGCDGFGYSTESSGPCSSPCPWAPEGDGGDTQLTAAQLQQLDSQPVVGEASNQMPAPKLELVSSGGPEAHSTPSSPGHDSTSTSNTTRSTAPASPPSHMDSRGPTPVTSPSHPTQKPGVVPPIKAIGRASASTRAAAEELSHRLKEDTHRPTLDKSGGARILPGHWKLGQKIGNGSFGQVYVGLNLDTGQFMAVKALPIGGRSSDAETLYQEIEVMRKLDHPNIVRYLGAQVSVAGGKVFIFQEWMAGGSVSSMVQRFGPLKPSAVRTYTTQLLQGLDYLHDHHIIHRDIKGGNLLVDDKGTVKLADFGASKQLGLNGSVDMLSGTLKGTPYFMAPEVLMESHYGRKSDIWSVGGAVLEMLTGEAPWKSMNFASAVSLMYHISNSKGPPPLPERMPPLLLAFLLRCFERDPDTRPSARELLSDPFLTEAGQEEVERQESMDAGGLEDRDSGQDWMVRGSSGDGTLAQGDLSEWDIKPGGSGVEGAGKAGEAVAKMETFEFLARAMEARLKENGPGLPEVADTASAAAVAVGMRAGSGDGHRERQVAAALPALASSPTKPPTEGLTSPREDKVRGLAPAKEPSRVGSPRRDKDIVGSTAGRPGHRQYFSDESHLRIMSRLPLEQPQQDHQSIPDQTDSAGAGSESSDPRPSYVRRRSKARSDEIGCRVRGGIRGIPPVLDHLAFPTPGFSSSISMGLDKLSPSVVSPIRQMRSSIPTEPRASREGLPLSPKHAYYPPSTDASPLRVGLTPTVDAQPKGPGRMTAFQDQTSPSASGAGSDIPMGREGLQRHSRVRSREVDDGFKYGEIPSTLDCAIDQHALLPFERHGLVPLSPSSPGGSRDSMQSHAEVAPRRTDGGTQKLTLPPLEPGTDHTSSRDASKLGFFGHVDCVADVAKFQVHRVVHATDVNASWDSANQRDDRAFVASIPAGCLDSSSTSVYIEAAGAQPSTARHPTGASLESLGEVRGVEWKCAKQSCGRLNTEDDDHCAFCATIRGSSGARGEHTSVYMR